MLWSVTALSVRVKVTIRSFSLQRDWLSKYFSERTEKIFFTNRPRWLDILLIQLFSGFTCFKPWQIMSDRDFGVWENAELSGWRRQKDVQKLQSVSCHKGGNIVWLLEEMVKEIILSILKNIENWNVLAGQTKCVHHNTNTQCQDVPSLHLTALAWDLERIFWQTWPLWFHAKYLLLLILRKATHISHLIRRCPFTHPFTVLCTIACWDTGTLAG